MLCFFRAFGKWKEIANDRSRKLNRSFVFSMLAVGLVVVFKSKLSTMNAVPFRRLLALSIFLLLAVLLSRASSAANASNQTRPGDALPRDIIDIHCHVA